MTLAAPLPSIGMLYEPVPTPHPDRTEVTTPVQPKRYRQALKSLLPTGYAWPRHPDSVWMRTIDGMADAFQDLHDDVNQVVADWMPHTSTRLDEWEEATGLPNICFGYDQTDAQRRQFLLSKLRGADLAYDDSSPACIDSIVAMCARAGYTATVAYNTPMRVGDLVGSSLGDLDGNLYITITREQHYFSVGDPIGTRLIEFTDPGVTVVDFNVGTSRVGDPLTGIAFDNDKLLCYLRQQLPARFNPILTFVGAT